MVLLMDPILLDLHISRVTDTPMHCPDVALVLLLQTGGTGLLASSPVASQHHTAALWKLPRSA
jgi:hypothetical protein